jgi:hypothetical protein
MDQLVHVFVCCSFESYLFQAVRAYLTFLNRKENVEISEKLHWSESMCLFVFLSKYRRDSFCIPRFFSLSNLNTDITYRS